MLAKECMMAEQPPWITVQDWDKISGKEISHSSKPSHTPTTNSETWITLFFMAIAFKKRFTTRDAPIDRPVIGIGRFLLWIFRIGDQSHVLLIPSQSFYCQWRRQRRHSHAHTHNIISQSHVSTSFSHENDSNLNGIQSVCVRETAHTK